MSRTRPQNRLSACLVFLLGVSAAVSVAAVEPELNSIEPYGVQRGTEVEVEFRGRRLDDAEELLLYRPGVAVKSLEADGDRKVKATLSVAPDCELGLHAVRVRTKTGVSDLKLFSVGALPEVSEEEPNSEFEEPQSISLGQTVSGVVQNEDVDFFAVEAKKGDRIVAEIEGLRLGNSFFDPYVAIMDEGRFELAGSDDAALLRQDCVAAIVAPKDGKYIIQVRESAYGGGGNSKYRLHVGSFPRPRAVYPGGGRPGESLEVRWIGDPAGEWTSNVTLPTDGDEEHGLLPEDASGPAPSPNMVRVVDIPNTLETEPNDDRKSATAAQAPGALNGIISEPGDVDYFKFSAKKGEQYHVRVHARSSLRSPLDSVLVVRQSDGKGVGNNDDSRGPDSYLRFRAPADDEYTVEIRDHLKAGGATYVYRVEITPVEPQLTLSLPERQRYESTTLTVPQGNRMALMVNAQKENFGGELTLDFPDLPEGLTIEMPPMPDNRSEVPVLFKAADDAKPAGALTPIIGRTTEEDKDVQGSLEQRTMLVRGRNNRDVWGHDAERMAAVVAEQAPFHLEIVQPQVPIVRGGQMKLKVAAKRSEGFDGKIRLEMLYNPPGIGSSRSIDIPEGKNEAEIPLTANGNAGLGTWKIVVTGKASHQGGSVEVASQMAELEVAEPFFNLDLQRAACEQGQEAQVVVEIEKNHDFEGKCEVELVGLPGGCSTEPQEFAQDAEKISFPVTVADDARAGRHKSLACKATITRNGEPILHIFRGGELRIDKPLPKKKDEPKPKKEEKKTEEPKEPAEKPLSRLEQLRQQREEMLGDK